MTSAPVPTTEPSTEFSFSSSLSSLSSVSFPLTTQEEEETPDKLAPRTRDVSAPTASWLNQAALQRGIDFTSASAPPSRPPSMRPETPWITRPPTPNTSTKPEPQLDTEPTGSDTPVTVKPVAMATNMSMPSWGGEVGEELTSKNFLKRAEGWLVQTQKSKTNYTKLVKLFYKDGSRAEKWHEDLTKGEKEKGWDHYSDLLLKAFPMRETVTTKPTDYIKELHVLQLEMEGLDVKNKEKNQWPHQKFADNLVYKELPSIIQSLVNDEADNWKTFTDELRGIDIKVVEEKLGTAKAIEELKVKQTALQAPGTPATQLANSFSNICIGQAPVQPRYRNQGNRAPAADPFMSNTGSCGNLFQGVQYQQPQQQQQNNVPTATATDLPAAPTTVSAHRCPEGNAQGKCQLLRAETEHTRRHGPVEARPTHVHQSVGPSPTKREHGVADSPRNAASRHRRMLCVCRPEPREKCPMPVEYDDWRAGAEL
ncbi:hypothetical protein AAF712_003268 [Marasmius tenuissimus]|uniref:Retrotransposon gag domain-containing protein n=1 Tax=Marasmius tenuissimus TaxID=585030 RepID=A0ABR3A7W6_9AGAR